MFAIVKTLRFTLALTVGGAALAAPLAVSAAEGAEDPRRLAAEIVVMRADAGKLFSGKLDKNYQAGLRARLRGGLALVPLLVRAARRQAPAWPVLDKARFAGLTEALQKGDGKALMAGLDWLMRQYPFATAGLLPPDARPEALKRAQNIHESYCAGCHDAPDMDTERPAWSLFELGQTAPPTELAARLVIGVRGEAMTAMDNPLRDAEMSALIAYYRAGPKGGS